MNTLSERIKTKFNNYFDKIIEADEKTTNESFVLDPTVLEKFQMEQEYIGMILLNAKTVLAHENRLLSVNKFSDVRHRLILNACNNLYNQGLDVDIVTVSDYLLESNRLNEAGGRRYINYLAINTLEIISKES